MKRKFVLYPVRVMNRIQFGIYRIVDILCMIPKRIDIHFFFFMRVTALGKLYKSEKANVVLNPSLIIIIELCLVYILQYIFEFSIEIKYF